MRRVQPWFLRASVISGIDRRGARPSLIRRSPAWTRASGTANRGSVMLEASDPHDPPQTGSDTTPYETIRLLVDSGGAAEILLARPEKNNAFNAQMVLELTDAFSALASADGVRVVFLRGEGRAFSAGGDLVWMREQAEKPFEDNEADALALASMLRALWQMPKLTVALVNGAAMGGGLGLVAACDAAIALDSARFQLSEVRLGLIPAVIGPYVVEKIGAGAARGLFASAESFDAIRAQNLGLVNHVITGRNDGDGDVFDPLVEHYSALARASAPKAVAAAKRLVREIAGRPIDDAMARLTAHRIAEIRASAEAREGLAAFLEKRSPDWAE